MENRGGKVKAKTQRPVWQLVLFDLLLTGFLLCIFATFHHVIPSIRRMGEGIPEPDVTAAPTAPPTPAPTQTQAPQVSQVPQVPETWPEKFAEHFSQQVQTSENSYSSPALSVTVTKNTADLDTGILTYYVADIYIADIENFRTVMPEGHMAGSAARIAEYNDAIIAVNGDFTLLHSYGICMHNGDFYSFSPAVSDICVLFDDGSVETYSPGEFTENELIDGGAWQIWQFGPELLEEDGTPKTEFNTSDTLLGVHPRCGFGYFEPGHYCLIVADGRQRGYSIGANMADFAGIFSELGCTRAYNLDGGASATMVFMGQIVNSPSGGGRYLSDMLAICEKSDAGEGAE